MHQENDRLEKEAIGDGERAWVHCPADGDSDTDTTSPSR